MTTATIISSFKFVIPQFTSSPFYKSNTMIKLGLVVAVLYFGSQKMLEVTSIRRYFIAECPVYLL